MYKLTRCTRVGCISSRGEIGLDTENGFHGGKVEANQMMGGSKSSNSRSLTVVVFLFGNSLQIRKAEEPGGVNLSY